VAIARYAGMQSNSPLTFGWRPVCAMLLLVGCSQPTPRDAEMARAGTQERADALADSIPDLIQSRVPQAVAGDSGWAYQQSVTADIDGDGRDESVVLIADVALDATGRPLWEDGHRWQVYVREPDGAITRLYARFLPNGKLTAELVMPPSGTALGLVLLEQTPDHIGVYEFSYRGPGRSEVYRRLDRAVDRTRTFSGSPRP
jgi:hypothetical protein